MVVAVLADIVEVLTQSQWDCASHRKSLQRGAYVMLPSGAYALKKKDERQKVSI